MMILFSRLFQVCVARKTAYVCLRNWDDSSYWKTSIPLWPAPGRIMRASVRSTRCGLVDHGVARSCLIISQGQGTCARRPGIWSKIRTWVCFFRLPEWRGKKVEQRSASRVGQGCPKERWCSALEVPVMRSLCMKLKMEKDWSIYMVGWSKLLLKSKRPRPR